MKSDTIPAVRVEPELRAAIEHSLRKGETLSAFVEAAVRESVRRRSEQAEFVRRGIASLEAARRGDRYVAAETVLAKLEERLAQELAERTRAPATAAE